MKNFTFCVAMLHLFFVSTAATYYSQGSLAPGILSSWNTIRTGGGAVPASFTLAGDVFVIQPEHVMVTSADWTFGSASSTLLIEGQGILQGDHSIFLTGTLSISNGAQYIHNNTQTISSTAGQSIFGGTENFSSNATVTIKQWDHSRPPLPAGVSWGNLAIDYTAPLGGDWDQQGTLSTINGKLTILHTAGTEKFQLTDGNILTLNIASDLTVSGGTLLLRKSGEASVSAIVQVQNNIIVSGGVLNLGNVDIAPHNELRFKGALNFSSGSISSESDNNNVFLVANGTASQTITSGANVINASVRVAPGATAALTSGGIVIGQFKDMVIAGTLNAGAFSINSNGEGQLIVAGGTLNSSGSINMLQSRCIVCTGNGAYDFTNDYPWCSASGSAGKLFYSGTMLFNKSVASAFRAGVDGSRGEIYLNNSTISFNGPGSAFGNAVLSGNSILSFAGVSQITGNANYTADGGTLVISADEGIMASGNQGNILVNGTRTYDNSNINSFEYKGNEPQFTGDGLPQVVSGALTVNNSSGLQLSNPVTIATGGSFNLLAGTLTSDNSRMLTLEDGVTSNGGSAASFVIGPIVKEGNDNFTFHIGKGSTYAPVKMENKGDNSDDLVSDVFRAEYFPSNPALIYGSNLEEGLNNISRLEYWNVTQTSGTSVKDVTFPFGPESAVSSPASLVVAYFTGSYWLSRGQTALTGSSTTGTIETELPVYGIFTLGSLDNQNVLPVKLKSFTGEKENGQGVLSWIIGEVKDADYFEILGSSDGRNYSTLGKINAVSDKEGYQFNDNVSRKGIAYYRLRITEKDGNILLSRIVTLFFDMGGLQLLSISPTVVSSNAFLTVASSVKTNLQVSVTSSEGRLVSVFTKPVVEGSTVISLDTRGFGKGIYYVTAISSNGRSNVVRFVKQ